MMPSVFIVVSWAVVSWVAVDAARRGRAWLFWAVLVWFTAVLGLGIWAVARRRTPACEAGLGRRRTALLWLAGAAIVAFGLILEAWTTTFVGQVVRVEGQAMAPTLEDRAYVVVNRMAYLRARPRRGDVVMLLYPVNPDKKFLKRIVAEEGDTVRITDGRVYVDDLPLDDNYVPPEYRSHDDWGPQVIPEGYCFVMGDHRNNSSDSRHWGMVPIKYVLGRVACRLSGARWLTAVR
jgi:signal peptidase I